MSKKITTNLRCNEQIRLSPIRVIGAENEQLGVISTDEAMRMAREAGMDLVEVAPNERPPVCRIMDYGKFKYHQKKHQKKHHEQQLKEVRIRPKTDDHDREIKINHALKFMWQGDKVQFTMQFRGRERAHRDMATEAFREVIAELGDLVKVERHPSMDGKFMIMILAPNKAAFDKISPDGKAPKLEDVLKHNKPAGTTAVAGGPPSPAPPKTPAPMKAEG